MREERSYKNLIFDTTVAIGIITILAYYEGTTYFNVIWGSRIALCMIPEIPINDILLVGGGLLFNIALLTAISIYIYNALCKKYSELTVPKIKKTAVLLGISFILLLVLFNPRIFAYLDLNTPWSPYSSNAKNNVIEIKLKYREKVENITNLIMVGKRDNFIIFLKENGQAISYNKDDILMINLKNTCK